MSSSFSGHSYDRWSYEQSVRNAGANDTALNRLQHKFWVTRTKVARKLGKDEDEHISASDAELDAKLDLFASVQETTWQLDRLLDLYQERLCNLACEENAMGRFLKDHGKLDRTRAGKMMLAVGKTMSYSGQQRLTIRSPLARLHQEVGTFKSRAIEDTELTVKAMEKARTDYRGALMWMKNVSSELDPDTFKQLEKFRKVQAHVKAGKARFDRYKVDVLQKVDLLAAARCNMFSHALVMYQDALVAFWKKTARTMGHVDNSFQGYQPFEFAYIRDLAEPSRQLAQNLKPQQKSPKKAKDGQQPPVVGEGANSSDHPSKGHQSTMSRDAMSSDPENLLYFDAEPEDQEAPGGPQNVADALKELEINQEARKRAEESLKSLLDLGGDEDDEDLLLLDIESHLTGRSSHHHQQPEGHHVDEGEGGQRPKMADKMDEELLSDLFGDDLGSNQGTFNAEWTRMFGGSEADDSLRRAIGPLGPSSASGTDLTIKQSTTSGGLLDGGADDLVLGAAANLPASTTTEMASDAALASTKGFLLPSQLFDLDQSLFSKPMTSGKQDLGDFPMPSPARPSLSIGLPAGQQTTTFSMGLALTTSGDSAGTSGRGGHIRADLEEPPTSTGGASSAARKQDMSQWFSLFADLDPLSNPDAIGKSTHDVDPNCYS